ncbi:MAG: NADPH:quinone reductase [Acidobacteria bacterium 13_1_20CM_2_55_15]|nr:MAG: NADPH:quinone reductase [Acidobacteria bacterium 13_1_40CM_56_16]OLE87308.1 MAG: NADPH:quinone reductase [Acidobacteria bacterium 13_1_20CM_2_55_15]
MKAIRVHNYGGPEVLEYEDAPAPVAGKGEAVVKIAAAGLNFVDIYYRTGLYKAPQLPFIPGQEAAGTVASIGEGVTEVKPGDRVAYAMTQGSYAEFAAVPAWKLVKLPENVDFKLGAAIMLQGMTAHYLTHSTFPLKQAQTALVHAGAGGVGLLLIQIAKKLGATVYTTVGNEAKGELVRDAGADEVIVYSRQDFEAEVKRLTGGRGVDVVYDSVGASTFEKSLNCLRPRGYLVYYGHSSGPVPPLDPAILVAKGSLFLTRPSLAHYAATREEVLSRANDLFQWLGKAELKVRIGHTFPLAEARKAHEDLAGRRTTGKVLLFSS